MADELVLYTNPMSRGRIVRWMLEEVGQPYKAEIIEYASMKSPEYLAINPMGKVPAVRHGETIVTEGGDLRLSWGRLSGGRPGAAAWIAPSRPLLPLDVLRRGPDRGGEHR
jgi:glutathione S-transferase